jgi:hypothetical protein
MGFALQTPRPHLLERVRQRGDVDEAPAAPVECAHDDVNVGWRGLRHAALGECQCEMCTIAHERARTHLLECQCELRARDAAVTVQVGFGEALGQE